MAATELSMPPLIATNILPFLLISIASLSATKV